MCMCVRLCENMYSHGADRGQKTVLDALELEFQMVLCHHMGARKRKLAPLPQQEVLVTTEPCLTRVVCFTCIKKARSTSWRKIFNFFLSPSLLINFVYDKQRHCDLPASALQEPRLPVCAGMPRSFILFSRPFRTF